MAGTSSVDASKVSPLEDEASIAPCDATSPDAAPAIAKGVLAVTLVGTGILLFVESTKLWFKLDDWDFLAHRGLRLGGTTGIFYPHNEHWTTIPIIIWRALFNVVGVRDYWLYSLPMILAHLAVVYLLWRFMLRHEIDAWTATLLAAAFSVVGVGWSNLTLAFQVTFVGSVAFGLLAIAAVDADRPWLSPIWGICSLMCSAIGIPMVMACGLVALAQGKRRQAAIAVVPPAVVFLIWYVAIGHHGTTTDSLGSLRVGGLASYVWNGLTSAFSGFLDAPRFVGAIVAVLLVAVAVIRRNVPAALAVSALVLYAFVGLGRFQEGANQAASSRYSYVALAMVLPLVGWLLTLLLRVVATRPLVMSALGLIIGLNLVVLRRDELGLQWYLDNSSGHVQMDAAAYLLGHGYEYRAQFPANSLCAVSFTRPECISQDVLSLATLAAWVKRGQFPVPRKLPPSVLRAESVLLGVSVSPVPSYGGGATLAHPDPSGCAQLDLGAPSLPVRVPASSSLQVYVAPRRWGAIATVTFPASNGSASIATIVHFPRGASWLNVSSSPYPTAVIASVDSMRVCQGAVT